MNSCKIININIDGLDCSGKETLSKGLEKHFVDKGACVIRESFPRYNTTIGQQIRTLLTKPDRSKNDDEILFELFCQDHLEFISSIRNSRQHRNVQKIYLICDRSVNSMLIYNNHSVQQYDRIREIVNFKYQQFENLYELNVFISMNNIQDERELQRRLLEKTSKDTNETLEKQREFNSNIFKARIDLMRLQHPFKNSPLKCFDNVQLSLSMSRLSLVNGVLHRFSHK